MPTKIQQFEDHLLQRFDGQPMPASGSTVQGKLDSVEVSPVANKAYN
jgi:hypothetical protein